MLQLVHLLWDMLFRHRHTWLAGLGLVVVCVVIETSVHGIDASILRHLAPKATQQVQKPMTEREKAKARRAKRVQLRRAQVTLRALDQLTLKSAAPSQNEFPAFGYATYPVQSIPDWGAMRQPSQWSRVFSQYSAEEFIPVPAYNMTVLTTAMSDLISPLTSQTIPFITAKLFYSTRFFGSYDIDSGEFEAVHPGVDLKLPLGTPLGAIGGGRVRSVVTDQRLGLHVMIEHRVGAETYYSIYGHMAEARVQEGETVVPGQVIGTVGMTGNTTAPHLHLQIDRGNPGEDHVPYYPAVLPSSAQADKFVVHPIHFIEEHFLPQQTALQ